MIKELEKLREIIDSLPDHNPGEMRDNILDMDTVEGIAVAKGLYYTTGIAVARTTLSAGTLLDAHYHNEKEIVIVYEGKLEVWHDQATTENIDNIPPKEYGVGDVCVFDPCCPHVSASKEGCKLIVITIPASKGFPRDGR